MHKAEQDEIKTLLLEFHHAKGKSVKNTSKEVFDIGFLAGLKRAQELMGYVVNQVGKQ